MQKKISCKFFMVIIIGLFFIFLRSLSLFQLCHQTPHLKTLVRSALPSRPRPVDAVMIVTVMRSGSSFFGSIFNHRRNVTYLYEPLIAVDQYQHRSCNDEKRKEDSIAIMKAIAGCRFEDLVPIYQQAGPKDDNNARCKRYNICFAQPASTKWGLFLSRDAGICRPEEDNHKCPEPIDPEMINKHCRKSLLKALKMIYLCKLEWLQPLIEDPDLNIKVIHLVRDPRSTINSRNRVYRWNSEHLIKNAEDLCENRLKPNLEYANNFFKTEKWRNKYIRIRYEDFALNPVGKTAMIFKALGINMTIELRNWLNSATSSDNSKDLSIKQPWDLNRNVESVLTDWRHQLSFEQVQKMQEKCGSVLKELGYKIFSNPNELKNLHDVHFTPDW